MSVGLRAASVDYRVLAKETLEQIEKLSNPIDRKECIVLHKIAMLYIRLSMLKELEESEK